MLEESFVPNVHRNDLTEDISSRSLTTYFESFRNHTIGSECYFESPYGRKQVIYADWTASGRLYRPIENHIAEFFGPYMANTHTESTITGTTMTRAYKEARNIIKQHVHANEHDILINTGAGMTSAVNKLQRILGLRIPEWLKSHYSISEENSPVIFMSHMEHHSNQLSWSETIGDVVCLEPDNQGQVDPEILEQALIKYRHRTCKIGSFTACSNVTGIQTPYHTLARKMHEHGGICFVDFAASAPYVDIDMHPSSPWEQLDGIYFSPHKFLGGPGSSGVLIFNSELYNNHIPDHPGGGAVSWTNAWGGRQYYTDKEAREDGGTPPILQTLRTALCLQLKERMGTTQIIQREGELTSILMNELTQTPGVFVLENQVKERLGIISFIAHRIHYNLFVKLLNDRFGIQARGGCSCAGPYGHYLLQINESTSKAISDQLDQGDLTNKPGWVRLSIHPTMTHQEVHTISEAVRSILTNIEIWKHDYHYDSSTNDWIHKYASHQVSLDELFTW